MTQLNCWNCGADASEEPLPLSRQACCQKCGEFLHCCLQCTQYDSNRPDSCDNELAEPPNDKSSANFCEFFKPKFDVQGKSANSNDAQTKLNALFGEDENLSGEAKSSNPLDDLFND